MALSNGRLIGGLSIRQAILSHSLRTPLPRAACFSSFSSSSPSSTSARTAYITPLRFTFSQKRTYAEITRSKIDLLAIDHKWQAKWAETAPSSASPSPSSSRLQYVLPMFPYPSGNLHLGHLRVYTIADVTARFFRLQGHDVLLPMGWDSFGLPAENAAIQRGIHPATWTRENIKKMRAQLDRMNGSWDWSRQISTCEPEFYKHTQRIFLELHKQGLAYQSEAEVNYDPVDQTVLANEQVDAQGRSWRSGAVVEKRLLKQWFLRISAYRDALLDDLTELEKNEAWPERVIAMQRNWLGKSTGALVKFPLLAFGQNVPSAIEVYTTRIDTLLGVQYIALAASHKVVQKLAEADPELCAFLDTLPGLPPDSKVGYMLPNLRAINPLAYHDATPDHAKQSLPVYVAPYVLGDYGEGAVMGVPGHDLRDHDFWKQHRADDPVRIVLAATEDEATTVLDMKDAGGLKIQVKGEGSEIDIPKPSSSAAPSSSSTTPFIGHGYMTAHSGPFKGRTSQDAAAMLLSMLEAADLAKGTERWRLRDWLVSRQRYWGAPIPIVHCDDCGAVPVPESELPVELPHVEHFGVGNPLASAHDWVNTPCPSCHKPAKRDTDTMDTFVDSSWYYMRFVDVNNPDAPFSAAASQNLPVDIYMGGIEHAILHLLYARFIYKFLMQSDLVKPAVEGEATPGTETETETPAETPKEIHEPFTRLITQGMVHGKTLVDPETGRFLMPDEVDLANPDVPLVKATGKPAATSYEKMSKSKHNGVDPIDMISQYGADATRAHMLFQAPVADVLNWDEEKISGVTRWLGRVHDLVAAAQPSSSKALTRVADFLKKDPSHTDADVWREVQTTIASVEASYARIYAINTVVSDLMRLTNTLQSSAKSLSPIVMRESLSVLVRLLAPITPAFAEECWATLSPGAKPLFSGSDQNRFPGQDGSLAWLKPRLQNCAVQINGKLRCAVDIPLPPVDLKGDELSAWLADAVLATEEGRARLTTGDNSKNIKEAKKTIVVKGGKLINFVF
ncbi:leucyl-trna synthetase [Ophiostoma piceae UAMH 11346]|uniref:leucine--tRNA ligase n=1 Tax=Ophiostoma piceae (strain UAMH 11346) TaxID=1262450 RepID=S3C7Y0_OPHP1|nr:leucyl-trna synthetase [Ophiostoma piceae UAMH 11346]